MKRMSKSFVRGFGRTLDLFCTQRKWPDLSNGKKKDYDALKGDWKKVGRAIYSGTRRKVYESF